MTETGQGFDKVLFTRFTDKKDTAGFTKETH